MKNSIKYIVIAGSSGGHILPAIKYLNELSISERGEYELTEATKNMIKDKKIIKGILMPKPLDLTDVKDLLINNFSYISNLLKNKG